MMMEKVKVALLTVALKAIAIWPYWVLHALSSVLYPIVYYVAKYRRAVTRRNLQNAFPEKSVKETVEAIVNHPLIPKDIRVHGFIIDSHSGKLMRITDIP